MTHFFHEWKKEIFFGGSRDYCCCHWHHAQPIVIWKTRHRNLELSNVGPSTPFETFRPHPWEISPEQSHQVKERGRWSGIATSLRDFSNTAAPLEVQGAVASLREFPEQPHRWRTERKLSFGNNFGFSPSHRRHHNCTRILRRESSIWIATDRFQSVILHCPCYRNTLRCTHASSTTPYGHWRSALAC